jgi:hypothetical protein
MGKDSTQPGCEISASLWSEFREDVRQRRGRINGVLGSELENALRNYLDGSNGGDVTDELRRLRADLDEVRDAVVADGGTDSRGAPKNKKNSSQFSKEPVSGDPPVSDGGLPVDDRHLSGEGQADDRSVVERRTDAAVAELVANKNQFMVPDLDEAIESGAGVASGPSIKKYRKRVFDRLGGKDKLVHPNHKARPFERQVFFVDADERAELVEKLEEERKAEAREDVEAEEGNARDAEAVTDPADDPLNSKSGFSTAEGDD